jgi:hypothetical protein
MFRNQVGGAVGSLSWGVLPAITQQLDDET